MDGDGKLIDRARTDAAVAFEVSMPPTTIASPVRQPLLNLEPDRSLTPVPSRHRAETVHDGAVWSLKEVGTESMGDEREADLIRRVLGGDAEAYAGIVKPHLPIAWRLAYSQLHSNCAAEDCVQKAAFRGWERLKNLKPGLPFRPWFLGIVVRQCQDERRSGWVTRRVYHRHWDPSDEDDWLERHLEGAELRRAFASLPRGEQMAIYLFLVEDHTHAEVADIMKISVSNVKSKIYRAKQGLRAALKEER
ncbi:MAG: RNA polymerase sigma factor [Chloroflexi bacterium]|nr:MAG: RNA polymerase sigma factor [Chloroflexota bacterium]